MLLRHLRLSLEEAHVWAMYSLRSWSLSLVQYCRGIHEFLFLANITAQAAGKYGGSRGNKNSLFPLGPFIKCVLMFSIK